MSKKWIRYGCVDNVVKYTTDIEWDEDEKTVNISLFDKCPDESAAVYISDTTDGNMIHILADPWFGGCVPRKVMQEISSIESASVQVVYHNLVSERLCKVVGVLHSSEQPKKKRTFDVLKRLDACEPKRYTDIALCIATNQCAMQEITSPKTEPHDNTIFYRLLAIERSNNEFSKRNFIQRLKWLFFGK